MFLSMSSSDKDIEQMLLELNDSDHKILVYLEQYDVTDSSLTINKKKSLPNSTKVATDTGLAANTTSVALTRLNLKGFILYTRFGMQKKAILTTKGMSIVNYFKKVAPVYYEELKKGEK